MRQRGRPCLDRERAGLLGVSTMQFARSTVAATSSSRFVTPNYWADPKSGIAYQIQVEIPTKRMNSPEELQNLPISTKDGGSLLLRDIATITPGQFPRNRDLPPGAPFGIVTR